MGDISILETVGRATIPEKYRSSLHEFILKAGCPKIPYNMFGMLFMLTLVVAFGLYALFLYPIISDMNPLQILIITFVIWIVLQSIIIAIMGMGTYFIFSVQIYNRTKTMENILPEYLTLVITNLKGGMSFENSLWAAIKPQFGVLTDEITIVSKKVMTGNDTAEALLEFAKKYDSPILRRSMNLIISEVQSGGEVAEVMDKVNKNLIKARELKEELSGSVVSFVIFIGVIVVGISPVLFALSYQLLNIMVGFVGSLAESMSGGGSGAVKLEAPQVDSDEFQIFSYVALNIISIFASMIIAIIQTGSIKGGLKYIPIFAIISTLLLAVSNAGLNAVFGGFAI